MLNRFKFIAVVPNANIRILLSSTFVYTLTFSQISLEC